MAVYVQGIEYSNVYVGGVDLANVYAAGARRYSDAPLVTDTPSQTKHLSLIHI